MHATLENHPSPAQLAAFSSGKLNAIESDDIERHLAECPSCCETLLNLPDDTLVVRLRDADTSAEAASNVAPTVAPEAQQATQWPASAATQAEAEDSAVGELPAELRDHPRYRILERVGRGGMGDVYKAEHKVMNRLVALKVIKPHLVQSDAAVRRFRREVQAAARLHHPNIVTAYDAEQAGDLHYLVMEFVDGVSLDEVLHQRGPLPIDEACQYIRQTALALQHAHELGMIHRDVKPHNLMVMNAESRAAHALAPVIKVLDFGLAGFVNEAAVEEIERHDPQNAAPVADALMQLTQMGVTMGTPDYIAPEQAQDAHTADIRSDIYSLGCTFYTLLSGRTPFQGASVLDKIRAHAESDAPPLRSLRPELPAKLEAIVLKMMAKDPALRYQTPAEVAEALQQFIDERIEAILRERGLAPPPPAKPIATGGHDASKWYGMLADTLRLGVAFVNLVFSVFIVALIAWLRFRTEPSGRSFAEHPLTLLIAWSIVPGLLLLPIVAKVRRMEGVAWVLLAAMVCLIPSTAFMLSFPLACVMLWRLLLPEYRQPLGAAPRPGFVEALGFLSVLLVPLALSAAGVIVYVELGKATIRFDVEDPALAVKFGSGVITVNNDGEPIRITPGDEHHFQIERSGLTLRTGSFTLSRGERVTLHVATVNGALAVTPGGKRFPLSQSDVPLTAQLPAAAEGSLIEDMRLEGHQDFVLALDYTPDGSRLITGGAEHVFVWSARNGRRDRELMGHTRSVHALVVSPDGKYVAAAGKGDAILVWELATGKTIQRLTGHTGFVECLAFSPDGRRIASGSSNWVRKESGDLTVRMWDVASGRELWQAAVPPEPKGRGQVYEVLFTPDGRQLVTVHHGPRDGVSVWDAETGQLQRRFSGTHSSIKCAALSPDGQILATGHEAMRVRELAWDDPENAVIRLWNFETGQEIGRLVGHTGGIQSVEFSSDGRQLVSCSGGQFINDAFRPDPSRDNTLRVWDVASRRELIRQPLEKHGQAAVFSPNGRFIASSAGVFNEKPRVQIWRLPESVWPRQSETYPEPQNNAGGEASEYFQRLAGEQLDSVVRERVGGGSNKYVESERVPQATNQVRYEARIDGVGAEILDNVFVDIKDLLRRGTDAQIFHEGQRGREVRLLRYAALDRNGEVRLTLSSREVGATPADKSTKWRLQIDVREWPRGASQGSEVIVEIARTDEGSTLRLDGLEATREDLLARLDALAKQDPGLQVRVEGDVVPLRHVVLELMDAIAKTAVGEQNVKFTPEITRRLMDDAQKRGEEMRRRKEGN
jgi:serine/threonine protein kinase/WD40 repeat protein